MSNPPLLFLDTETLGLDINAPIWEVAALRVRDNCPAKRLTVFVKHVPGNWALTLPKSFQDDYSRRFDPEIAVTAKQAIDQLSIMCDGDAIVVGSNPSFDMQRLEKLSSDIDGEPLGWHYHPIDIPTMVHGYLLGKGIAPAPPWKSDFLSRIIGIDPERYDRHTANGDVQWCFDMWRAVTS